MKKREYKNIMVTGGSGFIGSNFIHYFFEKTNSKANIINLDKLTYAGNPNNLTEIQNKYGNKRYFFYKQDICDFDGVNKIFQEHEIDCIIHFAAESHVDRSIFGPKEFIESNIMGTFNLLEVARQNWKDRQDVLFQHTSTDEVYGS